MFIALFALVSKKIAHKYYEADIQASEKISRLFVWQ